MCYRKCKAFTLAEAMVVFAVLGVLAAILIPAIFTAAPDQSALRAKKAYHTFTKAIEALSNSDVYAPTDGNFNATTYFALTGANNDVVFQNRRKFFCQNLAKTLNTTQVNCENDNVLVALNSGLANSASTTNNYYSVTQNTNGVNYTRHYRILINAVNGNNNLLNLDGYTTTMDTACEYYNYHDRTRITPESYNLRTSDGTYWGVSLDDFRTIDIVDGDKNYTPTLDINGVPMERHYALVCFNTDNNSSQAHTYSVGVSRDGKVLPGRKLQTLLQQSQRQSL